MKRFLLTMAVGVIAVVGLGYFATSASAHPVSCAPVRYHRAATYRQSHWGRHFREHYVRFAHRKPC
jgi:hypothetical protein